MIGESWNHFVAWIEALNKTHAGLLVFSSLVLAALAVVFGGVQARLAYLGVAKRKRTATEDVALPVDPSVRLDLINRVETEWVHDRLHQGLRYAIRVDLKLTETIAAVRPMLRIHTITESGQPEERNIDDDILNIFERANGRLLILGEPGTGKTNLLLELAERLIAKARTDDTLPIPIVFSLPRWTLGGRPRWTLGGRPRTLADWLIDDLADVAQYGLSRSTAGALVRQNRITPLLDGLDEVAEEHRAACVEAIHAYQQERDLAKVAICCRIAEYELLPKLNLRTAIRVEKLSQADVVRYISMDRLTNVRRALEGDPELLKIIDTPLWLHVAVLAAEVEPSAGVQAISPRDRLYARFVNYAVGREAEGSPRKQTPGELLMHWLGFLASEMKRRAQTQFSFEDLDDSWLPTKRAARWIAGLVCGLLSWLMSELVGGPFRGQFDSLLFGLCLCAGLYVVGSFWDVSKQCIEELYFARRRWRQALRVGFTLLLNISLGSGLVGLVAELIFGFVGGSIRGLMFGLIIGPLLVLMYGLGVVLQPKAVSRKSSPNRGTLRSLHYAVILFLSGTALGIGITVILPRSLQHVPLGMLFAGGVGLVALIKGGMFALAHYAVRLLLWRHGVAPLRYVRFLNEAADRLFLMRRGGSYEFFHITFRDYMADTYGSKNSKL